MLFRSAGDVPLITAETLNKLVDTHQQTKAAATILTAVIPDAGTYGRIIRKNGQVQGIREAKDCSPEQLAIQEFNTGIYIFKSAELFNALKNTDTQNKQGEYYLTDVVHILNEQNKGVEAVILEDVNEVQGINTKEDLDTVNQLLASRKATVSE